MDTDSFVFLSEPFSHGLLGNVIPQPDVNDHLGLALVLVVGLLMVGIAVLVIRAGERTRLGIRPVIALVVTYFVLMGSGSPFVLAFVIWSIVAMAAGLVFGWI